MHFYETGTQGEIQAHETLEQAIKFAEENKCEIICEIGGNWEEWLKCSFCGDWFPSVELNEKSECNICEMVIRDHNKH